MLKNNSIAIQSNELSVYFYTILSFTFLESRDIKKSRMCCFRRPPRYLELTAILIIFECSQIEALPETITIGKIFRMFKVVKAYFPYNNKKCTNVYIFF